MRRPVALPLLVCPLVLAACPTRNVSNLPSGSDTEIDKWIPVNVNRNADILFVIDNSGSMKEEQTSLAVNFPRFINVLETIEGGLPDVHIGVISTNVGLGGYMTTGCLGEGDDGRLQNAPRGACTPPSGYFISDVADPDGGRITNHTGSLSDTFSCIAQLGTTGCGFEQHLESMKRALDGTNAQNANFVRDSAYLAVIFVTDEDDCSAQDPQVFDPTQTEITDPLGPFSGFRCAEFGIQCDGAPISRSPACYESCEPRGDSYIHHPDYYVDFLRSLKDRDEDLVVAGIIGNPTPVCIGTDMDGEPEVNPSCGTGTATAAPGVRLKYFLDQFGDNSTFTSICDANLSDALTKIALLLAEKLGTPCLDDAIDTTDVDADEPGLQLQCAVADVYDIDTDQERSETIPRCPMAGDDTPVAGSAPCWWVTPVPMVCTTSHDLAIQIERNVDPPLGTTLVARCVGT